QVCASEGVQNQIVQDFEEISSVADFCDSSLVKYGFITLFILYNFGFESMFQSNHISVS
ncbi:unnamed protein product, partial [Brassica napus]